MREPDCRNSAENNMAVSLTSAFLHTPSVHRFVTNIVDDLADGNSTLILLPSGISPTMIWRITQQQLWQRSFSVHELTLKSHEARSPLNILSDLLNVTWNPPDLPRTLENLIQCMVHDGYPPDVIYLADSDQSLKNSDWQLLIKQWAEAIKMLSDRGIFDTKPRTALCIFAPAEFLKLGIDSDVFLKVHWWWGFPSALEIHLLCREEIDGDVSRSIARWREYLLSSLACNDISLIEILWDRVQELTQDNLVEILSAFANDRQWSVSALKSWGADALINLNGKHEKNTIHNPSPRWRQLWANGAIIMTTEYGPELHPAALVVLNRQKDLLHRLWRGQATLLLPLVDHARLRICTLLTEEFGAGWPLWYPPKSQEEVDAVRENPLACQWGHIEMSLRHCNRLITYKKWISLVYSARTIRNDLAHYRPIHFSRFEELAREIGRLGILF